MTYHRNELCGELVRYAWRARARQMRLDLWSQPIVSLDAQGVSGVVSPQGNTLSVTQLKQFIQMAEKLCKGEDAGFALDLGVLLDNLTESALDLDAAVAEATASVLKSGSNTPKDVILYGLGRVGRMIFRLLANGYGSPYLKLHTIAVRGGAKEMARRVDFLRRDSVHGPFKQPLWLFDEGKRLRLGAYADGDPQDGAVQDGDITILNAPAPNKMEYGTKDALLIDTTGVWRTADGLGQHLESTGVEKVLLTVPGAGIPDVVYGVNESMLSAEDNLITAASCTTNAVAVVLDIVQRGFGIVNGHLETVHAYTNDQYLVDNVHKKARRGRAAATNLVITSTGAAKAVADVVENTAGKLTGNAIRAPVADVSLGVLSLKLEQMTTAGGDGVLDHLRTLSRSPKWSGILAIEESTEAASSDFVGSKAACVIDAQATITNSSTNTVVLYLWYDNEMGYSTQVLRLAEYISRL